MTTKPIAVITRTKIDPTPGRNYRAAWKYVYDVHGLDANGDTRYPALVLGQDGLAQARSIARRNGYVPVDGWDKQPREGEERVGENGFRG